MANPWDVQIFLKWAVVVGRWELLFLVPEVDETTWTHTVKPCPMLGKSITNQSVAWLRSVIKLLPWEKLLCSNYYVSCALLYVILPSIIFQRLFYLGFFFFLCALLVINFPLSCLNWPVNCFFLWSEYCY